MPKNHGEKVSNSHAHDALPTKGKMRHTEISTLVVLSANARVKNSLLIAENEIFMNCSRKLHRSNRQSSWDHWKLGSLHSFSFQGFDVPICITQSSRAIVIMTLRIATFQYLCACFVQLSLHLLLLLLLLLISACDSLSLFVSLPHHSLDWLFY